MLTAIAAILVRRGERPRGGLTDAQVRYIEKVGRIDREDVEPLDIPEIRGVEDEFWSEEWDEPEDMGDPRGWERPDEPWR